jgi:hypothetical protein
VKTGPRKLGTASEPRRRPAQALLLARAGALSSGNARKNDRLDATFSSRSPPYEPIGWPRFNPRTVRRATTLEVLRLLTERREGLVAERTRDP